MSERPKAQTKRKPMVVKVCRALPRMVIPADVARTEPPRTDQGKIQTHNVNRAAGAKRKQFDDLVFTNATGTTFKPVRYRLRPRKQAWSAWVTLGGTDEPMPLDQGATWHSVAVGELGEERCLDVVGFELEIEVHEPGASEVYRWVWDDESDAELVCIHRVHMVAQGDVMEIQFAGEIFLWDLTLPDEAPSFPVPIFP